MKTRWKFLPTTNSPAMGHQWRWVKPMHGKVVDKCDKPFEHYYDCLVDAQEHGYRAVETKIARNGEFVIVCAPDEERVQQEDPTQSDCLRAGDLLQLHERRPASRRFCGSKRKTTHVAGGAKK